MRTKLLNDHGERTFAVIFDTGDDPVAGLTRFAEENKLAASAFTAIGAFSEAVLGYFAWEKKDYERIPVKEQVEVLALVGDIALQDGKPKLHAHAVLGRRACGPRWKSSSRNRRRICAACMTPRRDWRSSSCSYCTNALHAAGKN